MCAYDTMAYLKKAAFVVDNRCLMPDLNQDRFGRRITSYI